MSASPKLWIRSASSATDPEAMKISVCASGGHAEHGEADGDCFDALAGADDRAVDQAVGVAVPLVAVMVVVVVVLMRVVVIVSGRIVMGLSERVLVFVFVLDGAMLVYVCVAGDGHHRIRVPTRLMS